MRRTEFACHALHSELKVYFEEFASPRLVEIPYIFTVRVSPGAGFFSSRIVTSGIPELLFSVFSLHRRQKSVRGRVYGRSPSLRSR